MTLVRSIWYEVLLQSKYYANQLLGTKYFEPSTWYEVLGTQYLVPRPLVLPSTWYQILLGTRYLVLGAEYVVLSTWYRVLGNKCLEPQVFFTKYLAPCTWYQVLEHLFSFCFAKL